MFSDNGHKTFRVQTYALQLVAVVDGHRFFLIENVKCVLPVVAYGEHSVVNAVGSAGEFLVKQYFAFAVHETPCSIFFFLNGNVFNLVVVAAKQGATGYQYSQGGGTDNGECL